MLGQTVEPPTVLEAKVGNFISVFTQTMLVEGMLKVDNPEPASIESTVSILPTNISMQSGKFTYGCTIVMGDLVLIVEVEGTDKVYYTNLSKALKWETVDEPPTPTP